jgi:Protein tyrosine and serine/threonine kinase
MIIHECALNGSLDKYLKGFQLRDNHGEQVQRSSEDLFQLVTVLMNFSWQVACGMEYLASKKVRKKTQKSKKTNMIFYRLSIEMCPPEMF